MNAFVEKVTRRNLAMKLLTNRTIALTLTNVHLERIIVTCLLIALTRNLYGHANVTMGIMVTAIIAPKSIIVSRIPVLSILNASVLPPTTPASVTMATKELYQVDAGREQLV